ncbi:MAG: hypothetical protein ACI4DR_10260 [Roseburia sp.]
MIGYPLDSHVEYDPDGTPIYDRAISSAPMRKLFKELFSDGVLPNPSTNMQVSAGAGMNIIISPGFAMCNGCMKLEEAQRTLAVQASSAAYDRIDTVVLRLNDNDSERICDFYIVQGTPAVSPVRPELTRTESIWELGLADLFITKNSTAVSNQRITDTRYDSTRCGVMSSISQFDTTTIYQQIQADLGAFRAGEQAAFMAWFDEMKNQLSEDAAGNLQNEIDSTNGRIGNLSDLTSDVKTDLVAALNWVAKSLSAFRDIFNVHSHAWSAISNKPLDYPPSAHNHDERYYTETEVNALISEISTRLASAARFIGLYQQQIVLEANGEFFQAIPAQYQNGGYFYLINCSGNSINFTANMEGYYMAAKNRGTGRLATTLQVYIFSTGI